MLSLDFQDYRPLTHSSPHVGPSGGGYCTDDTTYVGTVEGNYFNIPFIPHGYLKN